MTKRTVHDCDRCDKKDIMVKTLHIDVDRRIDAAGSSETWTEDIDLCLECMAIALTLLIKDWSFHEGKTFLKKIAGKNWHKFWSW